MFEESNRKFAKFEHRLEIGSLSGINVDAFTGNAEIYARITCARRLYQHDWSLRG